MSEQNVDYHNCTQHTDFRFELAAEGETSYIVVGKRPSQQQNPAQKKTGKPQTAGK